MAIDDNASYELTGYQVKDLAQKIRAKADSASLASVATSGLYSDLTGAPTIPTVYNGTLTIQQNGTTLGTFSANQSSNETINIAGGGATVTEFYLNSYPGNATHVYKDSAMQTLAAASDINDALDDGSVRLVDGSHEYDVVWYDKYGGMASNGYWGIDSGTEVYYMSFVDSTTLFWDSFVLQEKLTAGSNITIGADGKTISATDTTYSAFTGATSSVAGTAGLVPAPAAGDEGKALHGDGTWKDATAKLVEMSYGESNAWAKFIAAYNAGSIVYCRASSNANPGTGSQTRKAFMAYVNNATSPTNVEFQYVRSQSSKTDSQQTDQVFVYTLTNTSGGTWSVASRNMGPKIVAGTGMTSTFTTGANATITLNAEPDYSTSEVDTKVKWVDNKTIYRKTVNFGALPNATTKSVAHGISGLSEVVKIDGIAKSSSGNYSSVPVVPSNASALCDCSVNATDVSMSSGSDRSGWSAYVTIYYTKS